jgi:hypothetical protein
VTQQAVTQLAGYTLRRTITDNLMPFSDLSESAHIIWLIPQASMLTGRLWLVL